MDVRRCLSRIGYRGPLEPNMETLRAVQLSFQLTVPFENLDIHLGKEIILLSDFARFAIHAATFSYHCNGGRTGIAEKQETDHRKWERKTSEGTGFRT
jgi:arylamine N-acetyltransferase